MKKSILVPIISIFCVALLLFGLNVGLKNVAQANTEKEKLTIMQTILPDSTTFTEETYTGEDANIHAVFKAENGYVIETVTYGYAGEIAMLIGVSNDGTVTGLVVREMSETFGLGANALNDHKFLAQFLNTSGDAAVGTNVDAITGATVTSKAITRCVNSAVGFVTGADTNSGATSWGG